MGKVAVHDRVSGNQSELPGPADLLSRRVERLVTFVTLKRRRRPLQSARFRRTDRHGAASGDVSTRFDSLWGHDLPSGTHVSRLRCVP